MLDGSYIPRSNLMTINLRPLFFPLLLACALGACSDEGTPSGEGDGDGDLSVPCGELGETECGMRSYDYVGEEHVCHPIKGRKLCDPVDEEVALWEFILCEEGGDGDGTAITCAIDPETEEAYQFPTTGIPAVWTEISCTLDSCGTGGAGGADD